MSSLFGFLRQKDSHKSKQAPAPVARPATRAPILQDPWTRRSLAPADIADFVHLATAEIKQRGVFVPYLLLPFQAPANSHETQNFVRAIFVADGSRCRDAETIGREVRLADIHVLISALKWTWARLTTLLSWDIYDLFKSSEHESGYAPSAFSTFIPLCVDSPAHLSIVTDFFDLL
ncbi:uncharacterized protein V1510DRAFT_358346, partial [Dipodascopsis tothii]|uniref:uncharacterized protein n=1 Tax=Dipodascopsis tothii TaxID=44089 RepID=UPI0034CD75EB